MVSLVAVAACGCATRWLSAAGRIRVRGGVCGRRRYVSTHLPPWVSGPAGVGRRRGGLAGSDGGRCDGVPPPRTTRRARREPGGCRPSVPVAHRRSAPRDSGRTRPLHRSWTVLVAYQPVPVAASSVVPRCATRIMRCTCCSLPPWRACRGVSRLLPMRPSARYGSALWSCPGGRRSTRHQSSPAHEPAGVDCAGVPSALDRTSGMSWARRHRGAVGGVAGDAAVDRSFVLGYGRGGAGAPRRRRPGPEHCAAVVSSCWVPGRAWAWPGRSC